MQVLSLHRAVRSRLPLDRKTLLALLRMVIRIQGKPDLLVRLSVAFLPRRQMQMINERYRQRTGVADVLSFHYSDPQARSPRRPEMIDGEILLCSSVIRERAQRQGTSIRETTAHLFIHGVLHLLGYQHHRQKDERRMQRMEDRVLDAWMLKRP
ncbi:MAG: rRNA maturation RNase YbeY [bacterium]